MENSDWVALLSFLVAILSAIYAKRSEIQAKHANKISSHSYKLEIFENFKRFRFALATNGENFETEELWPLLSCSTKAKLYFKGDLVSDLKKYSELAIELYTAREHLRRLESTKQDIPNDKLDHMFCLLDKCLSFEDNIINKFEQELIITEP